MQDLRARARDADADTLLTELLDLHEYTSSDTKQISDISPTDEVTNTEVILDGVDIVGFREPEPVAAATLGGNRGLVERGIDDLFPDDSPDTAGTTSRFEAYPHLQAPDGIPFRTKFEDRLLPPCHLNPQALARSLLFHCPSPVPRPDRYPVEWRPVFLAGRGLRARVCTLAIPNSAPAVKTPSCR